MSGPAASLGNRPKMVGAVDCCRAFVGRYHFWHFSSTSADCQNSPFSSPALGSSHVRPLSSKVPPAFGTHKILGFSRGTKPSDHFCAVFSLVGVFGGKLII